MINEAFAYMTSVIHILDPNVDEDDISFKLQSYPGDDPSERWQLTVEDANDNEIYDWRDTSPETVITATVGSLWLRTDGGAGTTLYVKETGTGNTGWAAK